MHVIGNPFHIPATIVAIIVLLAMLAAVGILAYDYIPWWRIFHRGGARAESTTPPACNPEERFGPMMVLWHPRTFGPKYFARWKGDESQNRLKDKLAEYPEWASISELSCQLFGHATFTLETWERLEGWLTHRLDGNDQAVADLPRSAVVRMLQEEVSKKH